jgi:uncharacterized DUF497 family protein
MEIKFEWNSDKADNNLKKHGISFNLSTRVFADHFALIHQDRVENGEYRWKTIGMVEGNLLILVAHTIRNEHDGTEIIRIISARRAESKERKQYEKNRSIFS